MSGKLTQQEHGGLAISNPFSAEHKPTHIIVDIPNSPPYFSHTLPYSYHFAQLGEYCQPWHWTFPDLVAYVLSSRAVEQTVVMVQYQWLRECVHAGEVISRG